MAERDSAGRFVSGAGSHGVKVIDKGYGDLMKRVTGAAAVSVGIHEDAGAALHDPDSDKSPTIIDVATWGEFGTTKAPARSWCAGWAEEFEDANKDLLRKIGSAVIEGELSLEDGIRDFGEKAKFSMVRRMGDGIPPPNTEATVARKRSSTPGIDTGVTRQAVDFKVHNGG